MATPYRHPRTGIYWFRKAVPEALRRKVGKTILSISLKTRDPGEARARYLEVALDVEKRWTALKCGAEVEEAIEAKPLSLMQRQGLAGEFHRWLIGKHEADPGAASAWRERIAADQRRIRPSGKRPGGAVSLYIEQVQSFLDERDILVLDSDLYDLSKAAAEAGLQAKETLARNAEGDYSPDPRAERFPDWRKIEPTLAMRSRSLVVERDWTAYMTAKGNAVSSGKRYRTILEKLGKFIGSKNLAVVSAEDIGRWKVHLAENKVKPETIKKVYLVAARSFFNWGIETGKVTGNPFAGVTVPVPKKPVVRRLKEFTDEEAKVVLSETLRPPRGRETTELSSAKRWIPWICAYTGARVNEITQMRCKDLRRERVDQEEVWVIHITPEAGTTKNGLPRDVPLHRHIVAQGFPEFVRSRGAGDQRVFYDPARRRGGSQENPQNHKVGQRLAAWVRDLGRAVEEEATAIAKQAARGDGKEAEALQEESERKRRIAEGLGSKVVKPNHAWRHRFKTVARDCRMRTDVRDAIQGHAAPSEGEKYGYFSVKAMWQEIKLIPEIDELPERTWPVPKSQRAEREYEKRKARTKAAHATEAETVRD